MSVAVLGPTRLFVGGDQVELSRVQVRRALTLLAARWPESISTDELIDFLWPDELPNDPRAALSVTMSRLRTLLGDHRSVLVSDSAGVRLSAEVEVDAATLSSVIAASEPTVDATSRMVALESALALWGGPPFGPDAESLSLAPLATRLAELRWAGATELLGLSFDAGCHEVVATTGRELHMEQPGREDIAGILARSLLSLGRRSDALAVLDRTRTWLREELGLESGGELVALERLALEATADVSAPSAPPRQADSDEVFVGRRGLIEMLSQPTDHPLVVVGEAGVGKSAVLRQLRARLEDAGTRVVSVAAPPSPERPAEAAARILEELAAEIRSTARLTGDARAAISRLAPGLFDAEARTVAMTRDVLVEQVASVIANELARSPAVLVVDDHHHIDALSNDVLRRLSMQGQRLVLGTRPTPARGRFTLERSQEIELEGLDRDEVGELVNQLSPSARPGLVDALASRSGGNALFLRLLVDLHLDGTGADGSLPPNVLVAVQERLQVLSASSLETVQLAAVFGSEAPLDAMRKLVDRCDADLDEAVGAHLVEIDESHSRVEIVHALVAEGAYQLIAPGRRAALHGMAADALEQLGHPASEYVRHLDEVADFDPVRAATAHRDAAREYEQVYAWDDVERHGLAGLALLGAAGDVLEAELAVLVGRSQRTLHRVEADDALLRAVDVARTIGDGSLFADAAIALATQNWSMTGDVGDAAASVLDEALQFDLSDAGRARVSAQAATLSFSAHHRRARELYHQGLDLALELDDPTLQAEVLRLSRWGLSHPDDLATLIETTELLESLAGDDPELAWGAATNRYAIGSITADPAMVAGAVNRVSGLQARLATTARDWEVSHIAASWALIRGDLDACDVELDRTLELATATASSSWVEPIYGACLTSLRRAQGRIGELVPFLDQALDRNPDFGGWRAVRAGAAARSGDERLARRDLDVIVSMGLDSLTPDQTWTGVMMLLSDAVTALHDADLASKIFDRLSPYSGRMSWTGVCTVGPIDAALGGLAELLGQESAAAEHRALADDLEGRFRLHSSLATAAGSTS